MVPGAGPHAQGRAGAFVAKADDPSALLHNPAGFAKIDGTVLYIGANLVTMSLTYSRTGRYEASGADEPPDYEGIDYPTIEDESSPSLGVGPFQAIPLITVSSDLGHPEWPVRFGFGIFVPQGYPARKFAEQIDVGTDDLAPGPQRYDIIEQDARTITPSIAVAYSPLANLDIGVRLGWGFASTKGTKTVWAIRNYEEYVGRDSTFTLDASDNFVPGFSLGALYRPTPWLELGAAYHSKSEIRAKGEGVGVVGDAVFGDTQTIPVDDQYAECEPGGTVDALKGCLDVDLPMYASVGARYILRDPTGAERADIEFDARWENWAAAANTRIKIDGKDNLTELPLNVGINRHGYNNVYSFRLGGAYNIPVGPNVLTVRAGAAYDTATAPDSWQRVDFDGKARTTIAGGLSWTMGRIRIEVGGGVALEPTITVPHCAGPDGDGPTVMDPGCSQAQDIPVADRTSPDPQQPKQGPLNQVESPFNAGTYESGYVLLHLGLTIAI